MLLDLNSKKIDNYKTKFNSFNNFLNSKSNVKIDYDTYKYKVNNKEYFITTGKYEYDYINDDCNSDNKLNSFGNTDLDNKNSKFFRKLKVEGSYRPVSKL